MPHTLAALQSGLLSEWRATVLVRETICLESVNRQAVDSELSADTGALDGVGTQRLKNSARTIAYRLEPSAAVARARKAAGERHVSCRPAPDTMAYLTALLPAAQAVGALAALSRHADAQIGTGTGGGRGRGQIMADTLVERVTGSEQGYGRVDVHLVMTDRTFLAADSEAADLSGYGPVPAQYARDLLTARGTAHREAVPSPSGAPAQPFREAWAPANQGHRDVAPGADRKAEAASVLPSGPGTDNHRTQWGVWLRRLYTAPETGRLVAMDSRARLFPPGLRRFIAIRDTTCRTPYCDAPIRHFDHIVPWRISASTSADGGQGLCQTCNNVKEAPGWSSRACPSGRHAVEVRTPTGHTYISIAPPLPGTTAVSLLDWTSGLEAVVNEAPSTCGVIDRGIFRPSSKPRSMSMPEATPVPGSGSGSGLVSRSGPVSRPGPVSRSMQWSSPPKPDVLLKP
ncbi:Uncharacterised protein [Arthrobacter agilis]|nr:Uncharacterised protein [Arthrobacter agilis]